MKKYIFFIFLFGMVLFFLVYSKNLNKTKNSYFDGTAKFIADFPSYNLDSKEMNFFKDVGNRIYIKIHTSLRDFVFMIDTGTDGNCYWGNNFLQRPYNLTLNDNTTIKDDISGRNLILKYVNKFEISGGIDFPGDGILGQPFLRQYKNVIFDYKRNKIIFNKKKISKKEISFFYENCGCEDCSCNNCNCIPCPRIYIFESYKGIKEKFLIDTGADGFVVRDDFPEGQWTVYKNDSFFYTTMQIDKTKYKNIFSYYASSPYTQTNDKAREYSKKTSLLGSPFFVNHIIQIDYENMKFRIK